MLQPHLDCRAPEHEGVWTLAAHQRRELLSILGEDGLIMDPELLQHYAGDESPVKPVPPAAVCVPRSAAQVAEVLNFAQRDRIPVTPRGGGSGKVGGAVPLYGGLVLSTGGLVGSVAIDRRSRTAVVPAGVLLSEVQAAADSVGLAYPPDPGSATWATLGGTIATNAGGPSSMKYGVTGDYVLALDVAMPNGQIMRCGHQSPKGVVGLDLAHLIVGSEGTLGVIVGATLRLRARALARRTLFVPFDTARRAMQGLGDLIAAGIEPRAAEFFDGHALAALRREAYASGADEPVLKDLPSSGAGLLLELDGRDESVDADLVAAAELLSAQGSGGPILARTQSERHRLWEVRSRLSAAVKAGWNHYVSEDVGLPPSRLPEFVDFLGELRERTGLHILSYGHAGDGNLHVNVLFDDLAARPEVDAVVGAIFQQVVRLNGTLSGEHGVGCSKLPWVTLEQGYTTLLMQRQIKDAFDPHGILNPGKLLPR